MSRIQSIFDRLDNEPLHHRLERSVVVLAVALFLAHILLVFLRNRIPGLPFESLIGPNYLSTLYTPFSVILVYEVYLMIMALPLSFNYSIRKQYEIMSLITIRNVFKDVAHFEGFSHLAEQTEHLIRICVDLVGGLLLFLLVGVFHHVSLYRARPASGPELERFVEVKRVVTLLLLALFVGLSAYSISDWSASVFGTLFAGRPFQIDLHLIFFEDFYTFLIFADVIILIASFLYSRRYATLLRNAGFVGSAVLLRISLAEESLVAVGLTALAILTGIVSQLIHNYYHHLDSAGIKPIGSGRAGA